MFCVLIMFVNILSICDLILLNVERKFLAKNFKKISHVSIMF